MKYVKFVAVVAFCALMQWLALNYVNATRGTITVGSEIFVFPVLLIPLVRIFCWDLFYEYVEDDEEE